VIKVQAGDVRLSVGWVGQALIRTTAGRRVADVKGRARDKAAEVAGQVKCKADQARQDAVAKVQTVLGQLADKTATARQKAQSAGEAGKGHLSKQAAPVWDAAPEPVRQAVARGASSARQRRVPLLAAAVALVLGYLVARRLRRR
jgi:hypothetical protein